MKVQFINSNNLDAIKANLSFWTDNFKKDSSEWLEAEFDNKLFLDSKFGEIPDFTLDMTAESPFLTEAANAQKVYENFKFLSDSQASDERLWASLCLGPFWKYVQYRWGICQKPTVENILQHYFFRYGPRRSLTRNAIARLWWIGRFTYDENRSDPYELTKLVCENSDYIMHILERNTSNNPMILRAFLGAILDARNEGINMNTNTVGELSKYLNLLGGIYILDCLSAEKIHDNIVKKAREITSCKAPSTLSGLAA